MTSGWSKAATIGSSARGEVTQFDNLGVLITCDSPSELIRAIVRGVLASDGLHNVEQQSPSQPRRCKLEYSVSFHKSTCAGRAQEDQQAD